MKNPTAFWMTTLLLGSLVPVVSADEDEQEKRPYSATRLIVKFETTGERCVEACAHRLLSVQEESELPQDLTKYKSLIELNKASKLKSIRSLFLRAKGMTTTEALDQQQELLKLARERFAKRTQRATKNKVPNLTNYYIMEFPEGCNILRLRDIYQKNPFVKSATLDYKISVKYEPNDPFFQSRGSWGQPFDDLWGLRKMNLPSAWDKTRGEGIVVAVVDSGIDYRHPDLADNIWVNEGEVADNGIDDDGNGYVDDVIGWDFPNSDNDPLDDSGVGHGTHVAGIIAAVGDNGIGITGVAPKARLMAVKGINRQSAEFSKLAPALFYAIVNGADVINNSWGPGTSMQAPIVIEDLVRTANSMGVVVVFAAGNDNHYVDLQSPPSMRETITVGSLLTSDDPAPSTNWGVRIDVCAPGGAPRLPEPPVRSDRAILSLQASSVPDGTSASVGDGYLRLSGTSMAAPHVSGLAALILANRNAFTVDGVRQVIRSSARDVRTAGFDFETGYGFADADRALQIDDPLELSIEEPEDGSSVNGCRYLRIRGHLSGPRLREYELSYSPMDNLGQRIIVSRGKKAPSDGMFGFIPVDQLESGAYLVRINATDDDGNTFHDAIRIYKELTSIRKVSDERDIESGIPFACSRKYVAWVNRHETADGALQSLTLHHIKTGKSRTIARNISVAEEEISAVDISSEKVYWATSGESRSKVFRYNIRTGRRDRVPVAADQVYHLASSGRHLALEDGGQVVVYDLKTNERSTLPESIVSGLDIDNEQVVWSDELNVFLYDLACNQLTTLTDSSDRPSLHTSPKIDGEYVVWQRDTGNNGEFDAILAYHIPTQRTTVIAENLRHAGEPSISEARVVWTDGRNANDDIFCYDLRTGKLQQITSSFFQQRWPQLSGTRLVWFDFSGFAVEGVSRRSTAVVSHLKLPGSK